MTWLTPIWLWLLLPWAAACLWSGRGTTAAARVPFLAIWPMETAVTGPRRRLPPVWVLVLLTGFLLMILAAAGPAVWRPIASLTVIVDRSPSMAGERLASALARLPITSDTRVRVVPVPGEPFNAIGRIDPELLPATALTTLGQLGEAFRREVGQIVVVTDQAIDLPPGVAIVKPGRPLSNAGIDRFAITSQPADRVGNRPGQAMLTIFNGTDRGRAVLRIDGIRQSIDLPPAGQSRDYFVDLPVLSATSEAELLGEDGKPWPDDVAVDNHAYLARTAPSVQIEPRIAVSDDLARMIAVYQHHRPAGPDAPIIPIVKGEAPATPAVILAKALTTPQGGTPEPQISVDTSHPVTQSTDFTGIDSAGYATTGPPGDRWRTLIRSNAEPILNGVPPLLAEREVPARQVWIGLDPGVLVRRADYVIFWTDVFDWLGGGATTYTAIPPRSGLTPIRLADAAMEGSPGLYRDGTRTVAVAIPAVRPAPVAATAPLVAPPAAFQADSVVTLPLVAALVLVTAALLLARGRSHSLTGF